MTRHPRKRHSRSKRLTAWSALLLLNLGLFVILAPLARAHFLKRPSELTIQARYQLQIRTLAHDRGVIRFFKRHRRLAATPVGRYELRWHKAQMGWTKRELRQTLSALESLLVPHKAQWLCIHRYEGDWEDGGNPHWGGLQMDWGFMHTYGADFIRKHGEPRGVSGPNGWWNAWTPLEQMIAAERAHRSGRGFYPWPNTARKCGLI